MPRTKPAPDPLSSRPPQEASKLPPPNMHPGQEAALKTLQDVGVLDQPRTLGFGQLKQGLEEYDQPGTQTLRDMILGGLQKEVGHTLTPKDMKYNPRLKQRVPSVEGVAKLLQSVTKSRTPLKQALEQLPPEQRDEATVAWVLFNTIDDVTQQLVSKGPASGIEWYSGDITAFEAGLIHLIDNDRAFKTLRGTFGQINPATGRPDFNPAKPETNPRMVLMKALMAPLSFGQNPKNNTTSAIRVLEVAARKAARRGVSPFQVLPPRQNVQARLEYINPGKTYFGPNGTPVKPVKGMPLYDNQGRPIMQGWTVRAAAVASGIKTINRLVAEKGEAGAAQWLLTPHPLSEIQQYNPAIKDLPQGKEALYPGAFVFGPKGGPFFLNLNRRTEHLTKDLWWSRTWNRILGTLMETKGGQPAIVGGPRDHAERRLMDRAAEQGAQALGLKVNEFQAVLWYYEQQLWEAVGAGVESYSYKEGINHVLGERGVTSPPALSPDRSKAQARREAAISEAIKRGVARFGRQSLRRERPRRYEADVTKPTLTNKTRQEESFWEDMLREPNNPDHAKVYADWLDENGANPQVADRLRNSRLIYRNNVGPNRWRFTFPEEWLTSKRGTAYLNHPTVHKEYWALMRRINQFYNANATRFPPPVHQASRRGARRRYAAQQNVQGAPVAAPAPVATPQPVPQPQAPAAGPQQAAQIAVSPNLEDNLSFEDAYQRSRSGNQKAFKKITEGVMEQLGLKGHTYDAIGDWEDGAENSILQEIPEHVDLDTLRYAAAWYGLLGNQRAVLLFQPAYDGKDSMYQMDVPDSNLASVRQQLQKNGIPFRTLIPTKKGTKVVIYDENRGWRDRVAQFAGAHNAQIHETLGSGEYLGGSTRTAARAKYRKVIDSYESSHARRAYRPGGEPQPPAGTGEVRQDQQADQRNRGGQNAQPAQVQRSRRGRVIRYSEGLYQPLPSHKLRNPLAPVERPPGQEESFFRSLLEEPRNKAHQKVYADWLEQELGVHPATADLVRKGVFRAYDPPMTSQRYWMFSHNGLDRQMLQKNVQPSEFTKAWTDWVSLHNRLNAFARSNGVDLSDPALHQEEPHQASRRGQPVRYAGVNAPAGGVVVRGLFYQGGKYIPQGELEKAKYDQYTEVTKRRQALQRYRREDGSYAVEGALKYAKFNAEGGFQEDEEPEEPINDSDLEARLGRLTDPSINLPEKPSYTRPRAANRPDPAWRPPTRQEEAHFARLMQSRSPENLSAYIQWLESQGVDPDVLAALQQSQVHAVSFMGGPVTGFTIVPSDLQSLRNLNQEQLHQYRGFGERLFNFSNGNQPRQYNSPRGFSRRGPRRRYAANEGMGAQGGEEKKPKLPPVKFTSEGGFEGNFDPYKDQTPFNEDELMSRLGNLWDEEAQSDPQGQALPFRSPEQQQDYETLLRMVPTERTYDPQAGQTPLEFLSREVDKLNAFVRQAYFYNRRHGDFGHRLPEDEHVALDRYKQKLSAIMELMPFIESNGQDPTSLTHKMAHALYGSLSGENDGLHNLLSEAHHRETPRFREASSTYYGELPQLVSNIVSGRRFLSDESVLRNIAQIQHITGLPLNRQAMLEAWKRAAARRSVNHNYYARQGRARRYARDEGAQNQPQEPQGRLQGLRSRLQSLSEQFRTLTGRKPGQPAPQAPALSPTAPQMGAPQTRAPETLPAAPRPPSPPVAGKGPTLPAEPPRPKALWGTEVSSLTVAGGPQLPQHLTFEAPNTSLVTAMGTHSLHDPATASVMKRLFPHLEGPQHELLAAAADAIDGSQVAITSSPRDFQPALYVTTRHPDGLRAERQFFRDQRGQLLVYNHLSDFQKGMSGRGLEVFLNQIKSLKALGVREIRLVAAGTYDARRMVNGYYTWARFGFDGDMKEQTFEQLPEILRRAMGSSRSILQLTSLEGGLEAWLRLGRSFKGHFDLSDGSPNLRALARYVADRQANGGKRLRRE